MTRRSTEPSPTSWPYGLSQPTRYETRPKQLQLFFDGTAVSVAEGRWKDQSNVFKMVRALHYEGDQITFYISGIGTRGDLSSTVTARGLDQIVREAYVNLASNFLKGDGIQIFGFSRGGAAALALVMMISKFGLLGADDLDQLETVWRLFTNPTAFKDDEIRYLRNLVQQKVRKDDHAPVINFLGLFDPVAGNSWDRQMRYSEVRLTDISLPDIVKAGVNILSIDDNRNPSFSPILWEAESGKGGRIEQIWMPGVHADVGGISEGVVLNDVALLTMIERARTHCPWLIWDDGNIETIKKDLFRQDRVAISDERFDLSRKLLWKASRKIGLRERNNEKLHPVFKLMYGREVYVRGRRQPYMPEHVPSHVKLFTSAQDSLFEHAFANIFERMHSKVSAHWPPQA